MKIVFFLIVFLSRRDLVLLKNLLDEDRFDVVGFFEADSPTIVHLINLRLNGLLSDPQFDLILFLGVRELIVELRDPSVFEKLLVRFQRGYSVLVFDGPDEGLGGHFSILLNR